MRAGGSLIHESCTCHSPLDSIVQESETLCFGSDLLSFQVLDIHSSISLFSDHHLLLRKTSDLVNWASIKQVMHLITIELKELNLDSEFTESASLPPLIDLFEDEIKDTWDYTNLVG